MSDKLKKQLILNLPYVLIGLCATKLGEAWRLAEGADVSQKFLHLMDGFTAAFQSPLPSFYPSDLLIGLAENGICSAPLCEQVETRLTRVEHIPIRLS